ncbi:hypothetical protein Tco_0066626 [Tanacetum coccineum]
MLQSACLLANLNQVLHNDCNSQIQTIKQQFDELDNVVEEEDGEWICFLGGNNSSGTKKYRGSNSSDGGNTRDGVKIAGGVIGSDGEIGEITDGIILEFSKELKEMLPAEVGK